MRLLSGPIKLHRSTTGGGASAAVLHRERKGYTTFFTVGDSVVQRVAGERVFTTDELFRIYQICPDIRAPIDKIALRVAHAPYMIQAVPKRSEPGHQRALDLAQQVAAFFKTPNQDNDWTDFAHKWATDLLIYDAFAVERVRGVSGKLQELVVWRGGDICPLQDEHGRVFAYRQEMAVHGPVRFVPEDLDYGNIFPNTTYPNGQPLIETLVEEFITMRAQAQHFRRLVDADEIPPGILALVGVADVALKRFEAKMKAQAGQDDQFRIVSTEDPAGKVEWIQLQRSLKDLDWLPNVKEVRKTIWRLFHVTPVTMGETDAVPRASAEVQVEIADQGLIGPMLRKLERLVNERWIPLILGSQELASMVYFSFDLTPDLSQQDQKVRAERLAALIGSNVISVNEARDELGYDPVDAGDDPVDQKSEDAKAAEGGESAAASGPGPRIRSIRPGPMRTRTGALVRRGDLPSDWQPAGRFKDVRTLPLTKLARMVEEYDDVVTPLYNLCARNVLREATDAVADGVFSAGEATKVAAAAARETERLIRSWDKDTADLYDRAARLGQDAASGLGGSDVPWGNLSATYRASAIGYLTASGKYDGIVTALRKEISALIVETFDKANRSRATRAESKSLPAALGAFLEAIRRTFERHQHRIKNWSGRLVELANIVSNQSLKTPVSFPDVDGKEVTEDRWFAEWVEVADGSTCGYCSTEGSKGFRPLDTFLTVPGGATECGSRCRCVLVYWLESEVRSGKATRLGPVRSRGGVRVA